MICELSTIAPKLQAGFSPNLARMILIWPSLIIVPIVPVLCIALLLIPLLPQLLFLFFLSLLFSSSHSCSSHSTPLTPLLLSLHFSPSHSFFSNFTFLLPITPLIIFQLLIIPRFLPLLPLLLNLFFSSSQSSVFSPYSLSFPPTSCTLTPHSTLPPISSSSLSSPSNPPFLLPTPCQLFLWPWPQGHGESSNNVKCLVNASPKPWDVSTSIFACA